MPGFLLSVALFAAAVTWFLAAAWEEGGPPSLPLDDGWIHLAFARSLAAGQGFALAGGEPVSGSTAPLWTLLLALPIGLGVPPVTAAMGLGILTGLAALLAAAALGVRMAGSTMGGIFVALGLAAMPRFVWGALSGMEVPLFTALVTAAVFLQLRERPGWGGTLLAGLAGWARPECFAVALFLGLHAGWRRREGRGWLGPLAALAAPLALWTGFHLALWGHPLPTTFYVKAAGGLSGLGGEGLAGLGRRLLLDPLRQILAFAGYIPANNLFLMAGAGLALARRESRRAALLVAGLILFYAWARGVLGPAAPWVQHGRYYTFLLPLWLALSAAGLAGTTPAGAGDPVRWLRPHAALLLLLTGIYYLAPGLAGDAVRGFLADSPSSRLGRLGPGELGSLLPWLVLLPASLHLLQAGLVAWRPPPARAARGLLLVGLSWLPVALPAMVDAFRRNIDETARGNVAMAEWIRRHTPPEAVVACHDVGALGFFGGRRLLDLAGIATPEVLFWPSRRPDGSPDRADWLRARRPGYLCLLEGWYPADLADLAEDVRNGRLTFAEVHRIDLPGNVTLGGEHYLLLALQWR